MEVDGGEDERRKGAENAPKSREIMDTVRPSESRRVPQGQTRGNHMAGSRVRGNPSTGLGRQEGGQYPREYRPHSSLTLTTTLYAHLAYPQSIDLLSNDLYPAPARPGVFRCSRQCNCERHRIPSRPRGYQAADSILQTAQRCVFYPCPLPFIECGAGFSGVLRALRHVLKTEGWSGLYDGLPTDTAATIISKYAHTPYSHPASEVGTIGEELTNRDVSL